MIKNIETLVEGKQAEYFNLSDRIWDIAETKFQEQASSKEIIAFLIKEGFTVESNIAEIDTAFIGT